MSISTTAYLMFGAPYELWQKHIDSEDLNDLLYDDELEYASPWYDSERGYWFVGFIVCHQGRKFEENSNQIREIRDNIRKICPNILDECYLTVYPHVM